MADCFATRGHTTAVGDEGGYAPELESDEEAIRFLLRAIEAAGRTTDEVKISLDAAATEWAVPGRDGAFSYRLPKSGKERTPDELIRQWSDWSERYPLLSIEDGLGEQDFRSWADMTRRSGRRVMLVRGRPVRHQCGSPARGIRAGAANAILIKPNRDRHADRDTARHTGGANGGRPPLYSVAPFRRDKRIPPSPIGSRCRAPLIKSGAPCRTERVAKYNRLLRIEAALGQSEFGL